MSYLNPLRLHFAGSFQAAISTVNNDPLHFDNATFKSSYQEPQVGKDPNGWFNPRGSGDWRLIGCTVTSAFDIDGSPVASTDPVLAAIVADSDRRAPAKLVDLDPEQQLVSMIWGLEVRIATSAGATLLRGQFEPAAFMDIWDRNTGAEASGDIDAGAMYQSVLTDLDWRDIDSSPFLRQLRDAATDGMLSIKFNVDKINMDFDFPEFMMGRVVGTIGPAKHDEPRHFVPGRQFMATALPDSNGFFVPAGRVNFCAAVLDEGTSRIYLDLGNALPTEGPDGQLSDLGELALYQMPADQPFLVGSLPANSYTQPSWYPSTAGIVAFPPDRALTADEFARLDDNPLALVAIPPGAPPAPAIAESPAGVFVRADQFVFRLNPGEETTAHIYATRFGHPYPEAVVITVSVPEQLQSQASSLIGQPPPVATPANAIRYDARTITDQHGMIQLCIRAYDPGTPRDYIDGQVYAIYPALEETTVSSTNPYPYNQWNFISLLVWSRFQPDEPVTWFGSIQSIFQQYANLYPVMQRFLDLSDYDSVCENIRLLTLAFGLDLVDPNSMPVTRDLSAAKRAAILRWLTDTAEDGMPRKGSARQAVAATAQPAAADLKSAAREAHLAAPPNRGGKTAAASRRPIAQPPSAADNLSRLIRDRAAAERSQP